MTTQETISTSASALAEWLTRHKETAGARRARRQQAASAASPAPPERDSSFRRGGYVFLGRPASVNRVAWRAMSTEQKRQAIAAAEAAELAARAAGAGAAADP